MQSSQVSIYPGDTSSSFPAFLLISLDSSRNSRAVHFIQLIPNWKRSIHSNVQFFFQHWFSDFVGIHSHQSEFSSELDDISQGDSFALSVFVDHTLVHKAMDCLNSEAKKICLERILKCHFKTRISVCSISSSIPSVNSLVDSLSVTQDVCTRSKLTH